ncbi:10657_t:CDS:1, partial [Paraglomus brasilianum]
MELELKGDRRLSKEMYYRIGEVLVEFKRGGKEIPKHRRRIAMKIYLMYKDNRNFDDGITIREIYLARVKEQELETLARRNW